jgi:hypothetical protein
MKRLIVLAFVAGATLIQTGQKGLVHDSGTAICDPRASLPCSRLGRRPYVGDQKPYTGRIDRITQWARVLSPVEIKLPYNNGSEQTFPFNTP